MVSRIDELVDTISSAGEDGTKICLLLGAGASKSAGIGLARDFVDEIGRTYPSKFQNLQDESGKSNPGYFESMAKLHLAERHKLINSQIDQARINWAHLAVALLEREGYADRLLTVNFDPLITRACAFLNRFPAIYDFAGLESGDSSTPPSIPSQLSRSSAICHLHGHHTGHVLLNTPGKLENQAAGLQPVLEQAMYGRVVIVCGYSGDHDPLVNTMNHAMQYAHSLYWFCLNDSEPSAYVRENLLDQWEDAVLVKDRSADDFFVSIARKLGIFPPDLVADPFSHLLKVFQNFNAFDLEGENIDLLDTARRRVEAAQDYDKRNSPNATQASTLLAQGRYQEIVDQFGEHAEEAPKDDSLRTAVADAYLLLGNQESDTGRHAQPHDAEQHFDEAERHYRRCIEIAPGAQEPLYNLGNLYTRRARRETDDESRTKLLGHAEDKFLEALEIDPRYSRALNNLGNVLSEQAEGASEDQRMGLLQRAEESCRKALEIEPYDATTLTNISHVLAAQAKDSAGETRAQLLDEAEKQLNHAEQVAPGVPAYDLACVEALRGDTPNAREWLEYAERQEQLPAPDTLKSDADLDGLRDQAWFQELVERAEARARGDGR